MKTGFDLSIILFQRLKNSALDTALTGDIYKSARPLWSTLEDVVINALPVTTNQIQRGVGNVNIYVPDLELQMAGKPYGVADEARLKALTDIALPILTNVNTQSYRFYLSSISTIAEPETRHHFVNLRIDFQFFP